MARFLAGLFSQHDRKGSTAVNWGIAAVVWYALARLVGRFILRRPSLGG